MLGYALLGIIKLSSWRQMQARLKSAELEGGVKYIQRLVSVTAIALGLI